MSNLNVKFGDAGLPPRFWRKVQPIDRGCWLWLASKTPGPRGGYGQYGISSGHMIAAHLHLYRTLVGPVPAGLQLDHTCRVRHCVNPQHLEPVTARENSRRGIGFAAVNARATHCPQGHAYTPRNVRMYKGSRHCRQCGCVAGQTYRERNKLVVQAKARVRYYTNAGKPVPKHIQAALRVALKKAKL